MRVVKLAIDNPCNRLKDLLIGGPTAPEDMPEGFLAKKGLSVEEFGRTIGVSRTILYKYIGGFSNPSPKTFARMAEQMGMTAEQLSHWCTPREAVRPRSMKPPVVRI